MEAPPPRAPRQASAQAHTGTPSGFVAAAFFPWLIAPDYSPSTWPGTMPAAGRRRASASRGRCCLLRQVGVRLPEAHRHRQEVGGPAISDPGEGRLGLPEGGWRGSGRRRPSRGLRAEAPPARRRARSRTRATRPGHRAQAPRGGRPSEASRSRTLGCALGSARPWGSRAPRSGPPCTAWPARGRAPGPSSPGRDPRADPSLPPVSRRRRTPWRASSFFRAASTREYRAAR